MPNPIIKLKFDTIINTLNTHIVTVTSIIKDTSSYVYPMIHERTTEYVIIRMGGTDNDTHFSGFSFIAVDPNNTI